KIDDNVQNESLDIIQALDRENVLRVAEIKEGQEFLTFNHLLNALGSNVHNLAMPYWIWTPEFSLESRTYFLKKKEAKRGPFKDLVRNRDQFVSALEKDFQNLV